jgi:hypothetical protein
MMDIKTAVKVIKALPPHISVLFRGAHGIGKSEVVKQIADDLGLKLLDRRMSQCSEGDTVGLPKQTAAVGPDGKSYDITSFCPPEFIVVAKHTPCVLFLDELNRATPEVMQACFQYALDRCDFQGEKFHPQTRVFAAINTGGNYQVSEMDPALLDRFFVIDLAPSARDFFDHVENRPDSLGGPVDPDLVRFLKERESRLDPSSANPGTVQPSRRSWVRLHSVYKANKIYEMDLDKDVVGKGFAYSLAVGLVGLEASSDLVDFLAKRDTRFTAAHVLNEYPKVRTKISKLGQDKLNTLIDMLVEDAKQNVWTLEQSTNLGHFIGDVPAELRVSFITNFTKALRNHANFTPNFKIINTTVMPHIVYAFNPNAVINGQPPPNAATSAPSGKASKSKKTT